MSDLRNASLVLRTYDLTINSITSVGECDAIRTSFTWYDINLRTLLGDMYDQYELFNLCLNSIVTSQSNSGAFTAYEDRQCLIKIGGLPFVNQTYDQKSGHNVPSTYIGSMLLAPSTATTVYFYSNNIATFGKYQDSCNITITYQRALDGATPQTPSDKPFPQATFMFDICGVANTFMKPRCSFNNPSYGSN